MGRRLQELLAPALLLPPAPGDKSTLWDGTAPSKLSFAVAENLLNWKSSQLQLWRAKSWSLGLVGFSFSRIQAHPGTGSRTKSWQKILISQNPPKQMMLSWCFSGRAKKKLFHQHLHTSLYLCCWAGESNQLPGLCPARLEFWEEVREQNHLMAFHYSNEPEISGL